jgi:hypothetical protein
MERTRKPLAAPRAGITIGRVATLIAGALIASAPFSAAAEPKSGWDWQRVNDGMLSAIDIAVLRPLGMGRIVIGAALLVPMSLFNAIALPIGRDPSIFQEDVERFIVEPVEYTFDRPIGEDLAGG